jgi:hypothetical protein
VQNKAARSDLGAATSSVNFARQIGSSVGVALIGALIIHRLNGQLATHLSTAAASQLNGLQISSITPQGLAQLPTVTRQAIVESFANALPPIFAYLVPLIVVAFLLALTLKESPLRTDVARGKAQVTPPQASFGQQGAGQDVNPPSRLVTEPGPAAHPGRTGSLLASALDRGITGERRRALGPRPESGESAGATPHSLVLQHCGDGLDAIAFLNVGGTVVSNQTRLGPFCSWPRMSQPPTPPQL